MTIYTHLGGRWILTLCLHPKSSVQLKAYLYFYYLLLLFILWLLTSPLPFATLPIAMAAPTPLPTSKVGSLYHRVSAQMAREWVEPVDKELANFQQDPACSWVHAALQQQQHVLQIGKIVQPQHMVSSNEEQQQTKQQEAQDKDFGGFMSASLPAFHLGFSFVQPFAATGTGTASPFSKHVHSISLDHTLSGDGSTASQLLAGHQKLLLPTVLESMLVCGSINVQVESEAYILTTRANAGPKSHLLNSSWT